MTIPRPEDGIGVERRGLGVYAVRAVVTFEPGSVRARLQLGPHEYAVLLGPAAATLRIELEAASVATERRNAA